MSWRETFGVFGLDSEDTASYLGERLDIKTNYVPVDFNGKFSNRLYKSTRVGHRDVKLIYVNPFQLKALNTLQNNGSIGILNGYGSSSEFEVYRRGEERSCEVRLPKAVTLQLRIGRKTVKTPVDTLVVKRWDVYGSQNAKTEMKVLEKISSMGLQNPCTIPLVGFSDDYYIQLIKIREPRVTYNDLPVLIDNKSSSEREKIYKKFTAQVFSNWANLASEDLFQLSMLPLDHHPEDVGWMYRCGGGEIRGGLNGLSNAGFLRVKGVQSCIIRDVEHVKTKDQILRSYVYKVDDDVAIQRPVDRFSVATGTALASILLMASKVGCNLRIEYDKIIKNLNDNFKLTYSKFYGAKCPINFNIPLDLLVQIGQFDSTVASSKYRINGQMVNGVVDQFLVDYFERMILEKYGVNRRKILDDLSKAHQISTTETMLVLSEIEYMSRYLRKSKENLRLKIFREIANLAAESPQKAYLLVDKIQAKRPRTVGQFKEIMKSVN